MPRFRDEAVVSAQTPAAVALLTLEQIREIALEAGEVAAQNAVSAMRAASRPLDRRELGAFLGCSLPTVDRLRAEGLPEFRVGDSPRFEREAVLGWLRARDQQQKER